MSRDPRYKKAKEKVEKKKEFYSHLGSYLVMSVFFFVLNLITNPGNMWFQWPILGWGIGVMFHYFDVFGVPGVGSLDKDWEEREIQKELRRLEGDNYQQGEGEDGLELKTLQREKQGKKWSEDDLV